MRRRFAVAAKPPASRPALHLFHDGLGSSSGRLVLTADMQRHCRARRAGVGDSVTVVDGRGGVAVCVLEPRWEARVVEQWQEPTPLRELTVASALSPHRDRVDTMVVMLAELGVRRLTPLRCDRSQAEPALRPERFAALVSAACEQSGRAWAPLLTAPATLREILAGKEGGWVAHRDGPRTGAAATGGGDWSRGLTLVVGPEGGFSPEEEALLRAVGGRWPLLRLSDAVLRIETAAVVGAATVLRAADVD